MELFLISAVRVSQRSGANEAPIVAHHVDTHRLSAHPDSWQKTVYHHVDIHRLSVHPGRGQRRCIGDHVTSDEPPIVHERAFQAVRWMSKASKIEHSKT
jgi:hypothetical protein